MPKKRLRTALLSGAVAGPLLLVSAAGAQVTSFTSRNAFVAALESIESNKLNGLPNGSTVVSFGGLGTATISGSTFNGHRIQDTGGAAAFSLAFSESLNGFGADFSHSKSASITLSFFDGVTLIGSSSLALTNNGNNFFGGTTVGTFNRVVVGQSSSDDFRTDDLMVGVQESTVMTTTTSPEPATVALFATGLAVLGGASLRRRRAYG
jgi:hypothetical protein